MTNDKSTDTDFPDDELEHEFEPRLDRAKKSAPRSGRVSSGLALIFAAIALCATGYLWYAFIYERPGLLQTDVPGTLSRLDTTTRQLREAQSDIDEDVVTLHETQETLKTAVEKLQNDLSRNRTEWMINEVEQLMLAANRRLQLARDVNSALTALRAADRQLELLANPNLLPVRRQLAREIAQLDAIERTDIAGTSLKLGSLADSLDRLPLSLELHAVAAPTAPATAPDQTTSAAARVWHDLLGLVRIRRHAANEKPLLPIEQQYFIRENLRLMLYGAQYALLQGNVGTYRQNLNTASRWLRTHFDSQSQAVTNAIAEIEKMRAVPMTELPDITNSLELLNKAAGRRRS